MPLDVWWSSLAGRCPGFLANIREPNIHRSVMSGFFPVRAWNGVLFRRVCGSLFFMYTTCKRAYDQYSGPSPTECSKHLIMFVKYSLGLSAIPFCADASAPVSFRVKSSLSTIFWNLTDLPSSPLWSVRTVRWGLSLLNLLSTLYARLIGGTFEVVRKIQM